MLKWFYLYLYFCTQSQMNKLSLIWSNHLLDLLWLSTEKSWYYCDWWWYQRLVIYYRVCIIRLTFSLNRWRFCILNRNSRTAIDEHQSLIILSCYPYLNLSMFFCLSKVYTFASRFPNKGPPLWSRLSWKITFFMMHALQKMVNFACC